VPPCRAYRRCETADDVAAAGIAVADVDRLHS